MGKFIRRIPSSLNEADSKVVFAYPSTLLRMTKTSVHGSVTLSGVEVLQNFPTYETGSFPATRNTIISNDIRVNYKELPPNNHPPNLSVWS